MPASAAAATPPTTQPQRVAIVLDVDETISITDYLPLVTGIGTEHSKPLKDACQTVTELSGSFEIIYLTHRPQLFFKDTHEWLGNNGFPRGIIVTSSRTVDLFWPSAYKARTLATLRTRHPNIMIGIGDRAGDARAHAANDLLAIVVNPRPGDAFSPDAVVLKTWSDVRAYFREHHDVLSNPDRLRSEYKVGGPPRPPAEVVNTFRDPVTWATPLKLAIGGPIIAVESTVKSHMAVRQAELREAISRQPAPLEQLVLQLKQDYPQYRLLSIKLLLRGGIPVYRVKLLAPGDKEITRLRYDARTLEFTGRDAQYANPLRYDVQAVRETTLDAEAAIRLARNEVPGQLIEIEIETDGGRPNYEFGVYAEDHFLEVEIDSQTGKIREVEDETFEP